MDIDAAWEEYLENGNINENIKLDDNNNYIVPKASELYISTKTKILYLNNSINLNEIFWNINIINFDNHIEGVIKKQIKLISSNKEELDDIKEKIKKYEFYTEHIITHIEQTQSDSIIYKDVRKISIGISQKDILSYRCKQKSAFYNCFVIILRLYDDDNKIFKEIHCKIFNTGKIEIPGVQNNNIFIKSCNFIINLLNNLSNIDYKIMFEKTETILINSNFHCGFYINRQKLFNIMRRNYNLNASYDPCSYPGIQCVYYYDNINKISITNNELIIDNIKKNKDIQKVSFMIFRTGSILIVGKCSEDVLKIVYEYVKDILISEYSEIMTRNIDKNIQKEDKISSKIRKKTIYIK